MGRSLLAVVGPSSPGTAKSSATLTEASEEAARLTKLANLLLLARSDSQQLELRQVELPVESWLGKATAGHAGHAEKLPFALRRRAASLPPRSTRVEFVKPSTTCLTMH